MFPSLPLRSSIGPSLQASQWQTCSLLIDPLEMTELLSILGEFWMVRISGLIVKGQEIINSQDFLEVYSQYISSLRQGELLSDEKIRLYFSAAWTTTLDSLYTVQVRQDHSLTKIHHPVVQLQAHQFDYSSVDKKFRSMVFGQESISWGIQFSYPSLYQNELLEVFKVRESSQFPNTYLFKKIQRWVRSQTIVTSFEIEGKRLNIPMRLGKGCLTWINTHFQLRKKGLKVCF